MQQYRLPHRQGLYDPSYEHDACGVGLLVNIHGVKSHQIVEKGLQVLEHMVHRGAEGADSKTGDGAGIMVQIPHEFILLQGIAVPEKGRYGTGLVFLPKDVEEQSEMLDVIRKIITEEGLSLLAIRDVPVNSSVLGTGSLATEPDIKQLFITDTTENTLLEPKLYVLRKKIEKQILDSAFKNKRAFYIVSLSSQNIVYKGM